MEEKIPFIKFKNSFYSGQLEVGTLMLGCRMDAYRQSNRGYFCHGVSNLIQIGLKIILRPVEYIIVFETMADF